MTVLIKLSVPHRDVHYKAVMPDCSILTRSVLLPRDEKEELDRRWPRGLLGT